MIRSTPPDRSKAPEIHQPTDIRLPKLHDLTLDNGIRVSVLNQPDMEIHRMTVFTEGGLAEAGNPAIALLDSQLLLEGTMATGAWTNSRCGNHHRSFAIYNLPSRRSKLLPTIIEILTQPAFPADRLAKWRERLIASTAIEQKTVGYQASLLSNRLTIGSGHPLSQPADPGHIAAVERDDILNFHKKNLHPRLKKRSTDTSGAYRCLMERNLRQSYSLLISIPEQEDSRLSTERCRVPYAPLWAV